MLRRIPARRRLTVEQLETRWALATLYVAPAGSDAGDGSSTSPWQTLQHAADEVVAGDRVVVRAGTYTGFDLRTDGTATSPITFSAEAGVLIDERNAVTPDGINLEGADYVTIEGFTVNGMPRTGIRSVLNDHVTIRNNRTDLNGRWGIFTGFSDDLLIENNVTTRSVAEHGIYVSNSGDRPVIRGNHSWGNRANGIHMNGDISQGGDGIISQAVVEANVIHDNGIGGGSGINADGVQNSVFRNNMIYDNHASGISLYRIDGGGGSSGNLVINNTIVQAADGRWALNITDGSTNNTVLNNVLYNRHSFRGSITISDDSLPGLTSDYNVVMNRFTTDDANTILSLAQWRALTGQDQHSIVATPDQLFVSPTTGDYHLKADSPAIDAGTSSSAPPRDFEGTLRPSGAGFDIGADEFFVTSNVPPTIGNLGGDVNWRRGAAPRVISSTATIADPDSPDFRQGVLAVRLNGAEAGDRLTIRTTKNVSTSGNLVKVHGITIGTMSGGSGTEPLVIVWNASALQSRVQAVLRNITFHSVSLNPSTTARLVSFTLSDGEGGVSATVSKKIRVV